MTGSPQPDANQPTPDSAAGDADRAAEYVAGGEAGNATIDRGHDEQDVIEGEMVPDDGPATDPADESPSGGQQMFTGAVPGAPAPMPAPPPMPPTQEMAAPASTTDPLTSTAPLSSTTPLTSTGPAVAFDYTDAGVPTLDYVRDKIEKKHGTALGGTELAGATDTAQRQREQAEERARLAQEKLAEIRRQVSGQDKPADDAERE